MEWFKKMLFKLLFPHIALLILLVPVSSAMLIYAFAVSDADEILVYLSYFLSAYTLTIVCVRLPEIYRRVKNIKEENKYVNRYMTDVHLRVKISLYGSLLINTAYAAFQLGLGVYHASVWFYSLAAYYVMLAIMRFFLLRDVRTFTPGGDRLKELYRYRFCGIILLLMNFALAVIVFYIAWQNRGFWHHPITTIAMAAYTFGTLSMAIVNVVKYRKYKSPVLSASKAISLAAASVSILTLETAMLTAFGDETTVLYRSIMTGITGAAVCIFVHIMAIYMIVKSNREIKNTAFKGVKNGEQK